jgi:hypothetical protein
MSGADFGRRPGKVDRELIAFPIDYEIDWLGQRSSRVADYCTPRACRRVDLSGPWRRKEYDRDVFEDLVIPRAHWSQIARKLSLSEALPSQSPVIGGGAPAAEEPRGAAMSPSPDIWLTPAQAVYFLVSGDDLVEVSRLSLEVVIGRLGRVQNASVPLSADAEPEELAGAWKKVREELAAAGESPCAVANEWRDYLLATGLVAADGRRTPSSPYEAIKPVEFCDLGFAGPHLKNASGNIVFYNVRMSGSGLWRARQQAIASGDKAPSAIETANVTSDRLPPHPPPQPSNAVPGIRAVPEPDTIPLIEAVHELRVIRNTNVRAAISEMIDLLATGQLPMAHALIDGGLGTIDARWWWVGSIGYPNSSAAFNLIIEGEARLVHATEICLDRSAWERQKERIADPKQQGSEPFPRQDDPAWDKPVTLIDAIRLWSPAFARCLDQIKWASPDDIRDIALRLKMYDHPTRVRARRDRAKRRRDGDQDAESVCKSPGGRCEGAADQVFPEPLRDAWARLLREWDQWDDEERLVHVFELAGSLIIENTKSGRPSLLEYAPPASHGDLSADYLRVDETRHEGLGPYDFDIRNSSIKSPGGSWLLARIAAGLEGEDGRRRGAREPQDVTAEAAWVAALDKPFRERELFGYFEIADHLTRSGVLGPDDAMRNFAVLNLIDWTRRQEFDLSGESEVVIKLDNPPYFRPFAPADIVDIPTEPEGPKIHDAQFLYLRRSACRRYIEANPSLENGPRLLISWFPEIALPAPGDKPISAGERAANAVLRAAIESALKVLGTPGKTVQWKPFCDHVRTECHATINTRGYGDKSIQRILKTIEAG